MTDEPITIEPVEVTDAPTAIPEITPEPTSDPGAMRQVYDADISQTILAKLSAYYMDDYNMIDPQEYFITRPNQYTYVLTYGDVDRDGTIHDCKQVTYYGTSTGYGVAGYTVSVSSVSSGRVDVSGFTGYVYSSYDTFLPSPDISTGVREYGARAWCMVLSVCLICCMLYTMIRRLFVK